MKKKAITAAVETLAAPALTLTAAGEFRHAPRGQIRISPDNRKRFILAALQELAANIKAVGIVQPIVVRPVTPTPEQPEIYEIVAGERRFRAATIAELELIPIMVHELSDLEAAKLRILENLQREDPHPMEEAEGYQLLMQQHGYDADQLAEEINKSRSYVYGRLKLCNLSLACREPFLEGKIIASTALLIARIPVPALQAKALDEIINPKNSYPVGEPMSYRRALEHLQNRYMLDLATAIFPINDSKLLAAAGSCAKCPKRTGNQPEIFTDISSADVCTDPDCFSEKRAAHYTRTVDQANKKGIPVLEGKAGADFNGDRWNRQGELVDGTESLHYFNRNAPHTKNQGSPLEHLPPDAMPEPAAYLKGADGAVSPAYKRADVQAALEKAGVCETVEEHTNRMSAPTAANAQNEAKQSEYQREQADRKARADKETAFRIALYRKLRGRGASGFSLASLREFAKLLVVDDNNYSVPDDLIGDVYPFERATDEAVCAYIDQASLPEVQMILVDLALGECLQVGVQEIDDLDDSYTATIYKTLEAMAAHEGIDPARVKHDMKMASVELADLGDNELADFIRVNPARINELKDYILSDRPYCLTLLQAAAQVNGLEYWQGQFINVDDNERHRHFTAETPATEDSPALAAEHATDDVVEAELSHGEPADDAEHLAAQLADEEKAPAKKAKAKTKTVKLAANTAWPFPKTATAIAEESSANVADESPAAAAA